MRGSSLSAYLKELEISYIKNALLICDGNKTKAAEDLGINRTTLVEKCKKYGLMKYGVKK